MKISLAADSVACLPLFRVISCFLWISSSAMGLAFFWKFGVNHENHKITRKQDKARMPSDFSSISGVVRGFRGSTPRMNQEKNQEIPQNIRQEADAI